MSLGLQLSSLVQKVALPPVRRTATILLAGLLADSEHQDRWSLFGTKSKEENTRVKKRKESASSLFAIKPSLKKLVSAKWTLLPLSAVYVAYPVAALLVLFRMPEYISLLSMFQNYHRCTVGKELSRCAQHYATQVGLFLSSAGSAIFIYKCRSWKWWKMYILALALVLTIGKTFVDDIYLYKPPDSMSAEGSLKDRVAIVTGANRGIGKATAMELASRGAHVVVTCRSLAKCQPVVDEINDSVQARTAQGSASAAVLDLNSLESAYNLTRHLTAEYPEIHYVFANAGTTPRYALTEDGFESGFGGMHLAHMALVLGILPSLQKSGNSADPARVVIVSSEMAINAAIGIFGTNLLFGGETDFDDWKGEITRGDGSMGPSLPSYARAKLCGVLFAFELNRRLANSGAPVVAHAVHTGAVVTDSSRDAIVDSFPRFPGLPWLVGNLYFPLLWRNVEGGARAVLCPALSKAQYILQGGQYLDALCRPFLHDLNPDIARDDTFQIPSLGNFNFDPVQALLLADVKWSKRLWDVSISFLEQSPAEPLVALAPL